MRNIPIVSTENNRSVTLLTLSLQWNPYGHHIMHCYKLHRAQSVLLYDFVWYVFYTICSIRFLTSLWKKLQPNTKNVTLFTAGSMCFWLNWKISKRHLTFCVKYKRICSECSSFIFGVAQWQFSAGQAMQCLNWTVTLMIKHPWRRCEVCRWHNLWLSQQWQESCVVTDRYAAKHEPSCLYG